VDDRFTTPMTVEKIGEMIAGNAILQQYLIMLKILPVQKV
jgi:hypothetical protein